MDQDSRLSDDLREGKEKRGGRGTQKKKVVREERERIIC